MINKLSITQKVAICVATANYFLGSSTYNRIGVGLFQQIVGYEIEMATYAVCVVLFLLFWKKKETE